jgi:exodeoxyribonuclease VII small subunit
MPEAEELSYEQALERLDATLKSLEEGRLTLEEAIAAVARGRSYLELCLRKLEEARQKIESLPVSDETIDEEAPHPATIADLRRRQVSEPEIPF